MQTEATVPAGRFRWRLPARAVVIAAGVVLLALVTRALLQPWLGDGLALAMTLPVVAMIGLVALGLLGARRPAAAGADTAEDEEGDEDGALFWLRSAAVLSVVVPLAVFGGVAVYSYDASVTETQRRMERLAAIAHEHAAKLFETNEVLIKQVNLMAGGLAGEELRRLGPQLNERLRQITQGMGQIHSVWLLDERGVPVVSSRMPTVPAGLSFADRDPFRSLAGAANDAFVVTPPRKGAVTGEPFFDLARRRLRPDGGFAGITIVGLHPGYFNDFYRELAGAERGTVITLVHSDGAVIARWPGIGDASPVLMPSSPMYPVVRSGRTQGRVEGVSSFDGQRRMGAFRKVGPYPLYVYAGVDEPTAMATWRRDVLALGSFILPMSACLMLVTLLALRRTRKQLDATRELKRESQERQKVEAALRQSQKLEAMGHLTGGVAHDFNNLLMVVNLNVSLLKRRLANPDDEKPLEAIQRAVGAGKKLTRQLLAFSHRQPLLPKRLDFAQAMPTLLDLIRPALGSRASADGEVEPGTACVMLDAGELELAMINLAVNARDAMPEGGEVHLHVRNAGDFVELAFRDTGEGIAPELVERVFEPFFTTKPVGRGTGLGLSQVYGLCKRAGGSARIESRPGEGTTIVLSFPAVPGEGDGVDEAAAPEIQRLDLRVLLVEDNDDIANATRELLHVAGCHVRHCAQAQAALDLLAGGERFDVVLSDIVMPGAMNGLELSGRIRSAYPGLPVVLMTGYAEKLHEAEQRGQVVLPKPFEPALLLRTLHLHVGGKNAHVTRRSEL